jgi:excisionase family DNA binding protein
VSEEEKLTVTEVARRLEVTPRTIRNWIQAGEFPNARQKRPVPGSPYQIPVSDVIAFEERRDAAKP